MSDDTGNEARARRITEMARERGWTLYEAVRYAISVGYLVAHWSDKKGHTREAGIVREFNTEPGTKERFDGN